MQRTVLVIRIDDESSGAGDVDYVMSQDLVVAHFQKPKNSLVDTSLTGFVMTKRPFLKGPFEAEGSRYIKYDVE